MEVNQIDYYAVGHYISTKSVGSDNRQDVTLLYKYPDGNFNLPNSNQFAIQLHKKRVFEHVFSFRLRQMHTIANLHNLNFRKILKMYDESNLTYNAI